MGWERAASLSPRKPALRLDGGSKRLHHEGSVPNVGAASGGSRTGQKEGQRKCGELRVARDNSSIAASRHHTPLKYRKLGIIIIVYTLPTQWVFAGAQ